MTKWAFLFAVLLAASVLVTACGSRPQIVVGETTIDLGDVVNGEVIQRSLQVENAGQAELTLGDITTSCGCTRASVEPATILPGGSATLHIEFDSGAHGPKLTGRLIRQVFIPSNDPQRPELVVELVANILPPAAP